MGVLLFVFVFFAGVLSQGQFPLPALPRLPIRNTIAGVYSANQTLFFRNSPYRVTADLIVEAGATLTIETGVQIYFDTGVGLKVKGAIQAIGNEFAHISMLPFQEQINYDDSRPRFRLVDGPSVRQGRLQMMVRDRWRAVCTQLTNWTSVDTGSACRSMGYGDGGFWKWYRRNNDTYPVVLPRPGCGPSAKGLLECPGLQDETRIPLGENLCQGEDDLGLFCWGQPTFTGWARHWKGLHIYNSPFHYAHSDPDMVAVHRESDSRLEFVDILYAGYDGLTKNATAALWIEGVPPIMNGIRVERSARDGVYIYEPSGPVMLTNSTLIHNRGHGLAVDNTTDGRVFVNSTVIAGNWGDGVWYRQRHGPVDIVQSKGSLYEVNREEPRADICRVHSLPHNAFFPHLLRAKMDNGTFIEAGEKSQCYMTVSLPPRLPYTYSVQFVSITNANPADSSTSLVLCDGNEEGTGCQGRERLRVPIQEGKYPQSVAIKSSGLPLLLSLEHSLPGGGSGHLLADIDVSFRVYASVIDKAHYGLNITNSIVHDNLGSGVHVSDIRERTALSNVTVTENQGYAGFLVDSGAADIWLNDTRLISNWGDGMNVSFAGGAVNVNGTEIRGNRWRGAAFHFNSTLPFLPLHHEIVFKGRPSNNIFYLPTRVVENLWGGILVGNFCYPTTSNIQPKVLISWVELLHNRYHPALEVHSCRQPAARVVVDVTGNRIEGNSGMGVRISPATEISAVISSNQFLNNNDTALFVRNAQNPELGGLRANVTISKNSFKFNRAKYIISIGMNEDSRTQSLVFNQQNEIRENIVWNPFPHLRPRSTPYAAMVVSSSNVKIHRNCFKNPAAEYEIAAELQEHAKGIDARENNWGSPTPAIFMKKIFDQFNRYSLATIDVNPYAAVCNQRSPHITLIQEYYREFQHASQPFLLGGTVYENHDLPPGRYTVTDDIHIIPGAKLTIAPGSTLEFHDGVGMLVQGELARTEFYGPGKQVVFTAKPFTLPGSERVRLVDEDGNDGVTEGRLEVLVDDEWGTVCNRSWTAAHASLACNQMGLVLDGEHFENWRIFPSKGERNMLMDNVRCEENEVDITRCRHDGVELNVGAGCRATEVVGVRCLEPRWAGVRYSLLANPPTVTGQSTMNHWTIEKAGLFDFRRSVFSPALQIDWNYHSFEHLTIRDNFWNGIDVIYNDLTRKPAFRHCAVRGNRRHGVSLRSVGITLQNMTVSGNGLAGFRYDASLSASTQRDISSWLSMREQPELEANNVIAIPNNTIDKIEVFESQLNQRKFLVAKPSADCPEVPHEPCVYEAEISASGYEYGLASKIAIQIVNPVSNVSDEDAVFWEQGGREWSARRDQLHFPLLSRGNSLRMRYTRSQGSPQLVLLVLYLDAQEYLDRFVHVYESVVEGNQYGLASVHHSNLSYADGTLTNRAADEKIWFQKTNFTRNTEAVFWINSPQHAVVPGTPIAEITYHLDNCSIHHNNGPVIEVHRDLFSSANVFHWNLWSNTFWSNAGSGIAVRLPDTYDLLARQTHSFLMTENRFEENSDFFVLLDGFHCFANVSSNNFTRNEARESSGMLEIRGMEKHVIAERNRFNDNWGHWMLRLASFSQSTRSDGRAWPALIQYNYFQNNRFINESDEYVDMRPRSYAIGVFGAQSAEVHFNRVHNRLIDFELVAGTTPSRVPGWLNCSHNWWGMGNEAEIRQRVFDVDDWNIYSAAHFSPYYTSEEQFINFWWKPNKGQLAEAVDAEPGEHDLHGRLHVNKTLTTTRERWNDFPHYYKPYRPYRITRDLTIMPGATLSIEKGVEVHVWPGVRILVLGNLIADGTYWEPIRFKPINTTEYLEVKGEVASRYRRALPIRHRRANRARLDPVYRDFPPLYRDDPYYQRFTLSLTSNGSIAGRSGFLQIHNATTGEIVPSCDRQFTVRNAIVACRQLGFDTNNAYHWVTPRWEYNPQIRLVKTYAEPRECRGDEPSLDRCPLRLSGNDSEWMCMDNEHFNYVYCGDQDALSKEYIGHWGGITFASVDLEMAHSEKESSVLRHVEIVGGGAAHNETLYQAALQLIRREPILDSVNVTNSSMHGIQVIAPREKVILNRVNVTDNRGTAVSVLTTNLQATTGNQDPPISPLSLPYHPVGMLDACAVDKKIEVSGRILLFYKYDSRPVDCVKIFTASGRKLAFRFIQVNLYSSSTDLGRADAVRVYSSPSFHPNTMIGEYRSDLSSAEQQRVFSRSAQAETLAVHVRATAADGQHGFIAEVSTLPSTPDNNPVEEVSLRGCRLDRNERGGLLYQHLGEMAPAVLVEDCSLSFNGMNLFGNVSTSSQAAQFSLHNTMTLLFRGNSVAHNIGGLLVNARSSSAVARLNSIVKGNLFSFNNNCTTLAFLGNNYQMVTMVNNIISLNYALYYDTMLVQDMSVNVTRNVFSNNTGLHTVDLHGYSRITSESQTFLSNHFHDNTALGHGHQYAERFGYLPEKEIDEFSRRPKRQVLSQSGVSFDWWTHVGDDTERYRSTILAGSASQHYQGNVFHNPANDYELTTSRQSQFDMGSIDARMNYWGWPGTDGVAAGKIRDWADYNNLIKVDYMPVLESNTSVIEGDCPPGWFQAGEEEFKSCFLYVAGAATHSDAVAYCEQMDSFMPYLRAEDSRQPQLASRIDAFNQQFVTDAERFNSHAVMQSDSLFWISGVSIPSTHCGVLSARTGRVGLINCDYLMPFVCEKGTRPYSEPPLWRGGVVLAVVIGSILIALLFILALCWCLKSRRRSDEAIERKNIIRASIKLQKKAAAHERQMAWEAQFGNTHASAAPSLLSGSAVDYDPFAGSRVHTRPSHVSPSQTTRTSCSDSLSTDHTYTYGAGRVASSQDYTVTRPSDYSASEGYYSRHHTPKKKPSSSAYEEIPQLNTFGATVRRRDDDSTSATPTSATPLSSGTASSLSESSHAASCTTCPPSDETLTDSESASTQREWDRRETQYRSRRDERRASTRHYRSNPNLEPPTPVEPPRVPRPAPPARNSVHGLQSMQAMPQYREVRRPGEAPPPAPARSMGDLHVRRNSMDSKRYMVETNL